MKRIVALVLVTIMSASLFVGCGQKNAAEPSQTPSAKPALTMDLTQIMDKIYENKKVELNLATIPVDLTDVDAVTAYTGLKDASKIKEVVVSEPMMGSQAYSLVLVRTNDSADAEAVADEMKTGIDPRKWICVEADDLKVATYGDVVMLIMVSTQLADTVTADEIVNAFQTVAGGTLDSVK